MLTAASRSARFNWVVVVVACVVLCSTETALRLGAASPDTRFTLPNFSLGDFWGTPLGWTGLVDGVRVNRDSVQFTSLSGFFRDEPHVAVPPQDNVYVRFAGYSLLGSALAPLLGPYAAFVFTNIVFWCAAAVATYILGMWRTGSSLIAALAAVLVSTAPAFAALAGQALPYISSYALFAMGLLVLEQARVFDRDRPSRTLALAGFGVGGSLLFYDLYMLPAFVVAYALLVRAPIKNVLLVLVPMLLPRLLWTGYWQAAHLPSYSHNEQHPIEALAAWFDTSRMGSGLSLLKSSALLAAHGALNIGAVFMFWPVVLAGWELWCRRRAPETRWFLAVVVAGFAPALFMLSTWPHIPRWYAYGFPAVYILAAAATVRLSRAGARSPAARIALASMLVLPAVVLANLDVVGYTKPMELLLFQPASWSYLWSR